MQRDAGSRRLRRHRRCDNHVTAPADVIVIIGKAERQRGGEMAAGEGQDGDEAERGDKNKLIGGEFRSQ